MVARPRPVRRRARRAPLRWLACGCLSALAFVAVAAVVVVALALPRLPELAASVIGLTARGRTEVIFEQATPAPMVQLQNAIQPPEVTVNLGDYGGRQTIAGNSAYYDVAVGSDPTGRQTAVVTFTEVGLNQMCQQRADLCGGSDPRYRNARIDLRPGGAVVYADVTVPTSYGFTLDETVGIVLQLDASRRQLGFAGIDLNGNLYTDPPPEFAGEIARFEQLGNDLLNQLSLDAGGGTLALSEVQADDSNLTVVMQ